MADKVYLTPTPGSSGHRGGGDPVLLQLRKCCHRKRSGEQLGGGRIKGLCGTERMTFWSNSVLG